jgi:hypothetical protein
MVMAVVRRTWVALLLQLIFEEKRFFNNVDSFPEKCNGGSRVLSIVPEFRTFLLIFMSAEQP